MLHFLLTPFLIVSAFFHSPETAYQQMLARVEQSVVFIHGDADVDTMFGPMHMEYSCSGFVVAPRLILTAKHCAGDHLVVDGVPAKAIKVSDDATDLALFETETDRPALALIERELHRGDIVHGIGHAFGWSQLTDTDNSVLFVNFAPDDETTPGLVVKGVYIGGMSGGPVIDDTGQVVGIVQRSYGPLSYGVQVITIRAFVLGLVAT